MIDGIDISTLEVKPGQIVLMTYDTNNVDPEQAYSTYKMLEAKFGSDMVIGVPKHIDVSPTMIARILEWVNFLKRNFENPIVVSQEEIGIKAGEGDPVYSGINAKEFGIEIEDDETTVL